MANHSDREDRFIGALLGTAFGDALGAPVEGLDRETIRERFGEVRDFLPGPRGRGYYTDDTQMTLALARSLVRCGGVDGADCARSYAAHFDASRGYGRSAAEILRALGDGADYRHTGTLFFPEGSYGNGAAMRIAPLGLLYAPDVLQKWRADVFEAVRCTHVHPEAVDGAMVQALAVSRMAREGLPQSSPESLLNRLTSACETDAMRKALAVVADLLQRSVSDAEAAETLGTGVASVESVPIALFLAFRYLEDPELALVRAVGLGGDADTIGAMTGAVVGTHHGWRSFPPRWFRGLENGPDGRDALMEAGRALALLQAG